MNIYFRKVLLTSIFVLCASGALAAPTVRALGGVSTVTGDVDSTVSARAGSLRSTGGYVRPTATTAKSVADSDSSATDQVKSPVAVSSGAVGLNRTSSSPQRLSIGKYIGAPRSISTEGGTVDDISKRVEKLEAAAEELETKKQDNLAGNEFITIEDNEIVLEVEHLKDALSLRDGREVDLRVTDDGLDWHYVGEEQWNSLLSWDELKNRLNISDISTSVSNMDEQLASIVERLASVETGMAGKINVNQGEENLDKVLIVGTGGNVTLSEKGFSSKVDVAQGSENAGKVLAVGAGGDVTTVDIDLAGKVDVAQGSEHAGKVLMIDETGDVIPGSINLADKVDVDQGINKAGKALIVGNDGKVTTGSINTNSLGLGYLAYKDQITNADVADNAAIERRKMAADITDTLYWVDRWRTSEPESDAARYVMAIDEYGEKAWFRVVVDE